MFTEQELGIIWGMVRDRYGRNWREIVFLENENRILSLAATETETEHKVERKMVNQIISMNKEIIKDARDENSIILKIEALVMTRVNGF